MEGLAKRIIEDFTKKYGLSSREAEVLRELFKGKSYREISRSLYLSLPAITYHTQNLLMKMKINNRHQIILRVIEWIGERDNSTAAWKG